MLLRNTYETYKMKQLNPKKMTSSTLEEFFKHLETPFYQRFKGDLGYNHLFYTNGSCGKVFEAGKYIPTNDINVATNIAKDNYLNMELCGFTGKKKAIIDTFVIPVYYSGDMEGIGKIINYANKNIILKPSGLIRDILLKQAYLIYKLACPLIITDTYRYEYLNDLTNQISKRLSNIFASAIYGGTSKKFKNKKGDTVKVPKLVERAPYKNDSIDINNNRQQYFITGGIFADFKAFATALLKTDRARKIGKKTKEAIDALVYIENLQNKMYHKTDVYSETDMLALQSNNIFNKAMLLYSIEREYATSFLELFASSMIKSKKDYIYYRRSLILLFDKINRVIEGKPLSVEVLEKLLYLTDIEKEVLANKYNFADHKYILVNAGINVYEDEFEHLRNVNYTNEVLTRMKKLKDDKERAYQSNKFSRSNRKFDSWIESNKAILLCEYCVENGILTDEDWHPRALNRNTGIAFDTLDKYKKQILPYIKKYSYLLKDNPKKFFKKLRRKQIEVIEAKRTKTLKIKVFEREHDLSLDSLNSYLEADVMLNLCKPKTIINTRKKNDVKVFYFIKKGIKVVYDYIAEISQVFKMTSDERLNFA